MTISLKHRKRGALRLDRDFGNAMTHGMVAVGALQLRLDRDFGNAMTSPWSRLNG